MEQTIRGFLRNKSKETNICTDKPNKNNKRVFEKYKANKRTNVATDEPYNNNTNGGENK